VSLVKHNCPLTRHKMVVTEGGWKACAACGTLSSRGVPEAVRFWSHTKQEGECIVWTGAVLNPVHGIERGWGRFATMYKGKHQAVAAYRFAWFLHYGRWPADGMDLDHLCRNRRCVRVTHLEEVPHIVNIQRKPTHGYCRKGHKFVEGNHYKHVSPRTGRVQRRCKLCLGQKVS